VYGILSFQLLLTFVAATVVAGVDVRFSVRQSPLLVIASFIVPFIHKDTLPHALP
ncbi:unnamed protein product, partial [Closterium sp. Naga37s-1]